MTYVFCRIADGKHAVWPIAVPFEASCQVVSAFLLSLTLFVNPTAPCVGTILVLAAVALASMCLKPIGRPINFDDAAAAHTKSAFLNELEKELNRRVRYGRPVSLLAVTFDFGQAVNDAFGSDAGDEVLEDVADGLRATVRQTDSVFRIGGHEISIILPATDTPGAANIAELIRTTIETHAFPYCPLTVSIGVATAHTGRRSAAELHKAADAAAYRSKSSGRDYVCCEGEFPGDPGGKRQEVEV